MGKELNRRDFLKIGGLSLGAAGLYALGKIIHNLEGKVVSSINYNNTRATAVAVSTPDNAKKIFQTFPLNVIKNSLALVLHLKNPDRGGNNWLGGSGMLILQKGEYQVVLTAAHVLNDDADETIKIDKVNFVSPQINPYPNVAEEQNFWFFSDPNKDLGIIVIKGQLAPDFTVNINKNWNAANSGDIYAFSYPDALQGLSSNVVPITVKKESISDKGNVVYLDRPTTNGASGSVFCDQKGNAVAVIKETYGLGTGVVPIGDSVDLLLRQASAKLGVNLIQ